MTNQEKREWISNENEMAVLWDNCDEAIIGITPNGEVVYSIEKLWEVFIGQGMTDEEAIEWVDYNILGAYVGEFTPIHVYTNLD
jgi:hypothetical protein